MGLPFVEPAPQAFGGSRPSRESSRYSVVGVPFDSTASYRTGQRWGPRAIREASAFIEFRSLHAGIDVDYVPIYDEGDVAVVPGDVAETLRRVALALELLAREQRLPVILGGEHTITYGVLEGLSRALGGAPCLVVFDAHLDLRDEYLGNRFSHACVMRRVVERLHPPQVVFIGVRGFADEEVDFAEKRRLLYITSLAVSAMGEANVTARVKRRLAGCERVYLSIDMDFLDPAYAPGVGNPEPAGLTVHEALNIIHGVVDERLVGVDVVEVTPPYDPSGITAVAAAKLLVEVVAAYEKAARGTRAR